jgi:hypothetical protein
MNPPCEDVTDPGKVRNGLGRANVPLAIGLFIFLAAWEVLLLLVVNNVGNGQEPDLWKVRTGYFHIASFKIPKRLLHVALPAHHPDITYQDVIERKGRSPSLDRHLQRLCRRRHRWKNDLPRPVCVSLCGLGLSTK